MHTIHTASHRRTGSMSRLAARCLAATAVVAASIAVAPSASSAADTGGCGTAWTLVDLDQLEAFILHANPELKERRQAEGAAFRDVVEAIFDAANRNADTGDEYVCARTNKGNVGQDKFYVDPTWDLEGHYVITNVNDNNSRPR
jgi:hypothetical protein